MLNEIKEFEQYTFPLDIENPVVRLKHKALCNDLAGIARAMTIIARRSMFDTYKDNTYGRTEKLERTKNDLRVWCGDPRGNEGNATEGIVFGWLPDYIAGILGEGKACKFEYYLMEEAGLSSHPEYQEIRSDFRTLHENLRIDAFREKNQRETTLDLMESLRLLFKELGVDEAQRKKTSGGYAPVYRIMHALFTLNERFGRNGFNRALFSTNLNRAEKNDFKRVTYEKIIADAICAGPLRRRYLVCEKEDLAFIGYESAKKRTYPFSKGNRKNGTNLWSEPTKKKADLIRKIVSAYLLEQKSRKAEGVVEGGAPVNLTDIANWLAGNTGVDSLSKYTIEGRPLIVSDSIDNVAVIGIDPQWMKTCGWQVIEEDQLDKYLTDHPEGIFYSDHGSGDYLKKNVRYI